MYQIIDFQYLWIFWIEDWERILKSSLRIYRCIKKDKYRVKNNFEEDQTEERLIAL